MTEMFFFSITHSYLIMSSQNTDNSECIYRQFETFIFICVWLCDVIRYSKSSQQPSDVQELHSMHMEVEVAPQPFSTPAGAGPSQYGLPDISVSDVSSEHHDR